MGKQTREEKNAYNRDYHRKNRDKVRARRATYLPKYTAENFEKVAAQQGAWYVRNKEKRKEYLREYRNGFKRQAVSGYGGVCALCPETELEFLSIDHVARDGADHRKTVQGSLAIYKQVIAEAFPDRYRCLCMNCNIATYREWQATLAKDTPSKRFRDRLKREVFTTYGHLCSCCGEPRLERLSLDHVAGGGRAHRREVGACLLSWAKSNGFPDTLRCLCHNCNMSAHLGGGVCVHQRQK